jgi:hypothetical protein
MVAEGMLEDAWVADIRVTLSADGIAQCMQLWLAIREVQRNEQMEDRFSWPWTESGMFSTKSAYLAMCHGSEYFRMAEAIWSAKAPLKCQIFMWLAVLHRLWTSDRRERHGLQMTTDPCYVCLQAVDTVEHILVQCPFAREVWFCVFSRLHIQAAPPVVDCNLQDWWSMEREKLQPRGRVGFDTLVALTCWSLWKNRNAWVFGDTRRQFSVVRLTNRILDELQLWIMAKRGTGIVLREGVGVSLAGE